METARKWEKRYKKEHSDFVRHAEDEIRNSRSKLVLVILVIKLFYSKFRNNKSLQYY